MGVVPAAAPGSRERSSSWHRQDDPGMQCRSQNCDPPPLPRPQLPTRYRRHSRRSATLSLKAGGAPGHGGGVIGPITHQRDDCLLTISIPMIEPIPNKAEPYLMPPHVARCALETYHRPSRQHRHHPAHIRRRRPAVLELLGNVICLQKVPAPMRNSCSGGSSSLTVTGKASIASNRPVKSALCSGRSASRASGARQRCRKGPDARSNSPVP